MTAESPTAGSAPSAEDQYDAARSGAVVHLLTRDVVSVKGSDAETYLQGQCSQDVTGLAAGSSVEALLLGPQGKIDAYIRVTRSGDDEFVIDTDQGFGPIVVARLQRFRLRTRVEIAPLAGWACVALRGPATSGALGGSPMFVLPVDWPGLSGLDLLGPAPAGPRDWVGSSAVLCGDEVWDALRIEAGMPVGGRDALEGSIPAETGLIDRTVSFDKGCYTGQELVARIDSRGSNVARRLCGVIALPEAEGGVSTRVSPPVGAGVWTADGEHEVGRLSSVAWSPGRRGWVALSMVHRRVEPPSRVVIRPDYRADDKADDRADHRPDGAGLPAEVRTLPLVA